MCVIVEKSRRRRWHVWGCFNTIAKCIAEKVAINVIIVRRLVELRYRQGVVQAGHDTVVSKLVCRYYIVENVRYAVLFFQTNKIIVLLKHFKRMDEKRHNSRE